MGFDSDEAFEWLKRARLLYDQVDDGERGDVEKEVVTYIDAIMADGRIDQGDLFITVYYAARNLSRPLQKWLGKRKEKKLYRALALILKGIAERYDQNIPGEMKMQAIQDEVAASSRLYRRLPAAEQQMMIIDVRARYEDVTGRVVEPARVPDEIEAMADRLEGLAGELRQLASEGELDV